MEAGNKIGPTWEYNNGSELLNQQPLLIPLREDSIMKTLTLKGRKTRKTFISSCGNKCSTCSVHTPHPCLSGAKVGLGLRPKDI